MITLTIDSIIASDPASGLDATKNTLIVEGKVTLSGSYGFGSPVVDGDPMDFAGFAAIVSSLGPKKVEVFQYPVGGNPPVDYSFIYGNSEDPPTQDGGILYVIDNTTGTQISQGAYDADLTDPTTNIRFKAFFPLEL